MLCIMDEKQILNLTERAKPLLGEEMVVTIISSLETLTVPCKFVEIGKPYYIGKPGKDNLQIDGTLLSPNGKMVTRPLKQIVFYFEMRKR